MSKRPCFGKPFDSQHVKGSQTLLKCPNKYFYPFFWSIRQKLSCKTCLLVISEILGLCANTLTANGRYSLDKREVTTTNWNVNIFEKQMSLTADVFPKLWICKDVVTYMSKRSLFRKPFGSQHVKGYQTLLKTPEQRFYPFFDYSRRNWVWKRLS